jgi:endonuclease YncB( thermonuclease family)
MRNRVYDGRVQEGGKTLVRRLTRLLSALLVLAMAQAALAAEIGGRVVRIADGDSLTVLDAARRQIRVRLAEIDAPESRQPYGSRARQALSEPAFGNSVRVVVQETDRYGRTVGRVYAGPVDVNAEMVRHGAAWVYRHYTAIPPCPAWSGKRTRRGAAFGRCRRRSARRPGNGGPRSGPAGIDPAPDLRRRRCRTRADRNRAASPAERSACAAR